MGARKRARKSKAKAKGKTLTPFKGVVVVETTVDPTKHTFAEIIFGRDQPKSNLKSRFEYLCNYREHEITDAGLTGLLMGIPDDLLLFRDEKNYNLLARCLTQPNVLPSLILQIINCMRMALSELETEDKLKIFFYDSQDANTPSNAVEIALQNKCRLDIIVLLILFSGCNKLSLEQDFAWIERIDIPCVDHFLQTWKEEVKALYISKIEQIPKIIAHKEFKTILRIHQVVTSQSYGIPLMYKKQESSKEENADEADTSITDANDVPFELIFEEACEQIKEILTEDILCSLRFRMKTLLDDVTREINDNKFKSAETKIYEALTISKTDVWLCTKQDSVMLMDKIYEALYSLFTVGIMTISSSEFGHIRSIIQTIQRLGSIKEEYADNFNIWIAKTFLCQDMFVEGLEFLDNTRIDSNQDYIHLMKALMYRTKDKDSAEIFLSLCKIKSVEVRNGRDFQLLLGQLATDGAEGILSYNFDYALKKFETIRKIGDDYFLVLVNDYCNIEEIELFDMPQHHYSNPALIDVLTLLIEAANECDIKPHNILKTRCYAYIEQGEFGLAEFDFETRFNILKDEVEDVFVGYYFCILAQQKKFDKIREMLQKTKQGWRDTIYLWFDKYIIKLIECAYICYNGGRCDLGDYFLKEIEPSKDNYAQSKMEIGTFEDLLNLCHKYMKSKNYKMTLKLAECALVFSYYFKHESVFVIYMIMAKCHRQQRDLDSSIEVCRNCLKRKSRCSDAYFEMGMSQMLKKNANAARRAFRSCLKINPEHKNAQAALAKMDMEN